MPYLKPSRRTRSFTETFEEIEVCAELDIHGIERELCFLVTVEGTFEPDDYEDGALRYAGGWSFEIVAADVLGTDTSTGEEFIAAIEADLIAILEEHLDEDALADKVERDAEEDAADAAYDRYREDY